MADFNQTGNKTVRCYCGHIFSVDLKDTIFKCPKCDSYVIVRRFGIVLDSSGNYIY